MTRSPKPGRLPEPLTLRLARHIYMDPMSGCWLWTGNVDRDGYGVLGVRHGHPKLAAHRVAWRVYRGEIPANVCVLHRCDVRCCVNPAHLFLGSNADNIADRKKKGRSARNGTSLPGETHPSAKLNTADVKAIRRAVEAGATKTAVAKQFGVSSVLIGSIARRKAWRHIP